MAWTYLDLCALNGRVRASQGGGEGAANTGREVFSIGLRVPEPGTLALLATSVLGLLADAWRRRQAA